MKNIILSCLFLVSTAFTSAGAADAVVDPSNVTKISYTLHGKHGLLAKADDHWINSYGGVSEYYPIPPARGDQWSFTLTKPIPKPVGVGSAFPRSFWGAYDVNLTLGMPRKTGPTAYDDVAPRLEIDLHLRTMTIELYGSGASFNKISVPIVAQSK